MKASTVVLAASAALVAAQDIKPFIPECAVQCLHDAAAKVSTCKLEPLDGKCICEPATQEKISGQAVSCVLKACGQDVAVGQVLPGTKKYCESVAAGGGSSGGSSSSAPASSKPAATTSMPASSKASSAPAMTSSTSMPASSAASTMKPSSATTAPAPTGGNSTTKPSGKPSSPAVPAGAASASAGFVGLMAAVGLGIFVL